LLRPAGRSRAATRAEHDLPRQTDPKKSNLERLILNRLRSFGLVVSIGFLLLVSLLVSAALAALSVRIQHSAWAGRCCSRSSTWSSRSA